MAADSAITIALVHPETLGVYGDRGNALALAHRARLQGVSSRVVEVGLSDAVPVTADLYLLGGGEDAATLQSWQRLSQSAALGDAVGRGAVVLGVCAGLQLLARSFTGADGRVHPGVGLLDVECRRLDRPRAVGEVLTTAAGLPGLGELTGFENHQGDARLGPAAAPLGRVRVGVGNGDGLEGAVQGHVVGTYLHGPVLPRNPALADRLLGWVVGPLLPVEPEAADALHAERVAAQLRARGPGRLRRRGRS